MPFPKKTVTPDLWVEARRLYEETNVPVADIASFLGIGKRTLYTRIKDWAWTRRIDRLSREAPPADAPAVEAPTPPVERAELARSLARTVLRELRSIDARLASLGRMPRPQREHEGTARTLQLLARVLKDSERLAFEPPPSAATRPDDDDAPQDMDALRDALTERLERMAAARRAQRDRGAL